MRSCVTNRSERNSGARLRELIRREGRAASWVDSALLLSRVDASVSGRAAHTPRSGRRPGAPAPSSFLVSARRSNDGDRAARDPLAPRDRRPSQERSAFVGGVGRIRAREVRRAPLGSSGGRGATRERRGSCFAQARTRSGLGARPPEVLDRRGRIAGLAHVRRQPVLDRRRLELRRRGVLLPCLALQRGKQERRRLAHPSFSNTSR
jgi:hypothetical protein